jgi:hypothetical protein
MSCKLTFVAGLLVWLLASVSVYGEDTIETAVPQKGENVLWRTIKSQNYTIYYGKEYDADAQRAKAHLNSTIEALRNEFSDFEPDEILKQIECHVYLHPEPNEHASDGRSLCITRGAGDGRRQAELHFLTPTRRNPHSRDSLGNVKDDHHFFRYIVHEYSSIWLGVIARGKEKGWYVNGNDAPNWFWQGYQEYLGMTLSSKHNRVVTIPKYMAVVKANPDSVMLAHGYVDKTSRIVVGRDYTDGFAILAFMHKRFGKQAVQSIITSERETFLEAMRDACRMDVEEFYENYQQWVQAWRRI